MAYTFHDEDGSLGPGPTINGLRELKKFLKTQTLKRPALDMLLEHGVTHLTTPLAVECGALVKKCVDPDVRSTLKSLALEARKAKGCVIMAA